MDYPQVIINPSEARLEQLWKTTPDLKFWCTQSRTTSRAYLIYMKNKKSTKYSRMAEADSLEELIPIALALRFSNAIDFEATQAIMVDCTRDRSAYLKTDAVCAPYYDYKDVRLVRKYDFRKLAAARTRDELGLLVMAVKSRSEDKAIMVEIHGSSATKNLYSQVLSTEHEPNVAARLLCGIEDFRKRNVLIFDCRATRLWPREKPKLKLTDIRVFNHNEFREGSEPPADMPIPTIPLLQKVLCEFMMDQTISCVYCLNICDMWYRTFTSLKGVTQALELIGDVCGSSIIHSEIKCLVLDMSERKNSTSTFAANTHSSGNSSFRRGPPSLLPPTARLDHANSMRNNV